MAGKVLDLDLSEEIHPIWGMEQYEWLYLLVRYHRRPIAWISISNNQRHAVVSPERLREAVTEQIGWPLWQQLLMESIARDEAQVSSLPQISVIVCTRDRTGQLADCLKALLALDYPSYEIVVVDNAPSDESTARLAACLPVRYAREDKPGLDWARNRGVAEARHGIIAFTDDDVRPDRFWLRAIGKAFVDSDVMAVSGLVAPGELETTAQHIFEFGYGGMGKGLQRKFFRLGDMPRRELLWGHVLGVGANMAFRREVFSHVGSFDVALDVGTPSGSGGDLDMLHRVVAGGHTVVYEPAALVWHVHRRSLSLLKRQLYDNGRGFGSYLITCLRNGTITFPVFLEFIIHEWLGWWLLRRLVRPTCIARPFVIAELWGAIASPFAYRAAQARARQLMNPPPEDEPLLRSVR
jgi:glycosyltransferase involved in cell wall biosynthesis